MSDTVTPSASIGAQVDQLLQRLGVPRTAYAGGSLRVCSPLTGETIGQLPTTSPEQAREAIGRAHAAYLAWRVVPGPRRGELVRLLGEELRAAKADLGRLVTLEVGKVPAKAWARCRR
jgi:aldehyde dehydrogenase (NAD+)